MVQGLKERGYTVKENAPVYYTMNMDKTAKWFEDILGWYAGIDQRNENGDGTYGCVLPLPSEIHNMTLIPFNGFHMFFGEPVKQTVAFMRVDNIDKKLRRSSGSDSKYPIWLRKKGCRSGIQSDLCLVIRPYELKNETRRVWGDED